VARKSLCEEKISRKGGRGGSALRILPPEKKENGSICKGKRERGKKGRYGFRGRREGGTMPLSQGEGKKRDDKALTVPNR